MQTVENNTTHQNDMDKLLEVSSNGTPKDIANVIHALYMKQYKSCIVKNRRVWYELKNNYWEECPGAISLRQKLSNDVSDLYKQTAKNYLKKAVGTQCEMKQEMLRMVADKMIQVSLKLKMSPFKNTLMKECDKLFSVSCKPFPLSSTFSR